MLKRINNLLRKYRPKSFSVGIFISGKYTSGQICLDILLNVFSSETIIIVTIVSYLKE